MLSASPLPRIVCVLLNIALAAAALAREPIPDKLVVLTFDDASKSHYSVARPLLRKHKFGATFFVTEGWDFTTNKTDYMSWDEIAQLHRDGFEIGNHTRDHKAVTEKSIPDLPTQVEAINARCQEHGIPRPVSFAYPGNDIAKQGLKALQELGFLFARRGGSPEFSYEAGGGCAYEPGLDHPLLIPTTGDARPTWTLDHLKAAVGQARHGKIAVLQFHGVPDTAHDWVSTRQAPFTEFMDYLAAEDFTVIAMRDLARYVDPQVAPQDPWGVIKDRQRLLAAGRDLSDSQARPAKSDDALRDWLENALVEHRFTATETGAALGMTADEVLAASQRFNIDVQKRRERKSADPLVVLPYPGGRHPRIGFRDGAIRPQRETKVSVFAPWADGGYAVADVPEAVWFEPAARNRELLYLAHTHVPTTWDRQQVSLEQLEWDRRADGSFALTRHFPNQVSMSATVVPAADGVSMQFAVANGLPQPLTGLRVQMCVMLGHLTGFEDCTNDNKHFAAPFAACHDRTGKRWVITAWDRCGRAWGNPPCPCLHSDPVLEDCPTSETRSVRGWLWFYEGDDIEAELARLKARYFTK